MKARSLYLMLCLIFSFTFALAVQAQDATEDPTATEPSAEVTETPIGDLSYNSPVVGRISSAAPSQAWPLLVGSADRVLVRVERVDGNLIPSVAILDSNDQELGSSYGPEYDWATALVEYTFPEAGEYRVAVTPYIEETEGLYRLTVIPLGTAEDNINNTSVIGEVQPDTPLEGEITPTHWYQRYTFNAPAADTIRIVAERTGGNLMPQVDLLDASGNVLTTGYNTNTGDQGIVDSYTLPSAGEYIVAVTRYSGMDGESEGAYRLTVETLGSGEGSPNLEGSAGTVEYDTALQGEITNLRWYQDWTLNAQAGDTIRIDVTRTGGNFQPEVSLIGGAGQELQHGYLESSGDTASISNYTLEAPGTYTVRVLRTREQAGLTTGTYDLVVTLLGSGEGSPVLSESSGTVAVGEPVEGEVTNRRWVDSWAFNGEAGQEITVTVERTAGTLIPMVEIRDINGQALQTAYPETTRDRAILNYSIPAAGTYTIAVMRENWQEGVTSGTYELAVTTGGE